MKTLTDLNLEAARIGASPEEERLIAEIDALRAHVAHLEGSLAKLRSAYDASVGALIVRLKRGMRFESDCPPGCSILLINPEDGESKDVVVSRDANG